MFNNKKIISQFLKEEFCDKSLNNLYEAAKRGEVCWYGVHPDRHGCLVSRCDKNAATYTAQSAAEFHEAWSRRIDIIRSPAAQAYLAVGFTFFGMGDGRRNRILVKLAAKEIKRREAQRLAEGKALTQALQVQEEVKDERTITRDTALSGEMATRPQEFVLLGL